MPTGRVISLPRRELEYGTAIPGATGSAWNIDTIVLNPAVADPDFWVVYWGTNNTATYTFSLGASQLANCSCILMHTTQSLPQALGIMRGTPGVTWPGTFNIDTGGTSWKSAAGIRMTSLGMRGEATLSARFDRSTSSTFPITSPPNPGPPGGMAVIHGAQPSGGSGPIDVSPAPWRLVHSGGLGVMAYYMLPLDRVLTPPDPTFNSGRSTGWSGGFVYIR